MRIAAGNIGVIIIIVVCKRNFIAMIDGFYIHITDAQRVAFQHSGNIAFRIFRIVHRA